MYAIRSYYAITFALNQVKDYAKNLEVGGKTEVIEKINFRITSYNVCYTKLLREFGKCSSYIIWLKINSGSIFPAFLLL